MMTDDNSGILRLARFELDIFHNDLVNETSVTSDLFIDRSIAETARYTDDYERQFTRKEFDAGVLKIINSVMYYRFDNKFNLITPYRQEEHFKCLLGKPSQIDALKR